jgi:hypothetical protein
MIEHAIYSLISSLCDGRVYYVSAPQDVESPYMVFFKVSAPREHSHEGASGLVRTRFQFSVFSSTYLAAKQAVQSLQGILQGYQGTSEGIYIYASLYDNETDMFEENLYHVAVDYIIWHRED